MERNNLMPIKVDFSKRGLDMCFRDYERIMLLRQWAKPKSKLGSGDLWRYANEKLPEGKTISRASVIFAANRFINYGIWDAVDRTGKGGHHNLYFAKITQAEFWKRLQYTANRKLVF